MRRRTGDVIATAAQVDNLSYQDNLKVRRDPDGPCGSWTLGGRKVMSTAFHRSEGAGGYDFGWGADVLPKTDSPSCRCSSSRPTSRAHVRARRLRWIWPRRQEAIDLAYRARARPVAREWATAS